MTTPADIVNRALQQIAGQATVTGVPPTFDGSVAGLAAGVLYKGGVVTLLRSQDWEFALARVEMVTIPGAPDGNGPFIYPADCVRVRQVVTNQSKPLDPEPARWTVMEWPVQGAPGQVAKSIVLNSHNASLLLQVPSLWYTTSNVTEDQWDSIFTEAMVRYLASGLAMAIGGRPDFSREKLVEAGQLMTSGVGRDA